MNSHFYSINRKNLALRLNGKAFAISANTTLQKTSDVSYPFRQDSNFWYLTGIDEPDCILIITPEGDEHLFIPQTTELRKTWVDDGFSIDHARAQSGIQNIHYLSEKATIIKKLFKNVGSVDVPLVKKDKYFSMEVNPATTKLKRSLKRYGIKNINDCSDRLAHLRVIKQEEEIRQLAEVTKFTEEVLKKCQNLFESPASEQEIDAYISAEFIRHGYSHGYEPIIAAGENAFKLHYKANNAPVPENTAILVDVGAEKNYYSADVTRMVEVGTMTSEYKEVKKLVVALQEYVVSLVKPGAKPADIAKNFRQELLKILVDLGLLEKNADLKETMQFCPHGFGHFLGLDVHDVGSYTEPLQQNMIFMVEPGLYVKEWNAAVRLEDAYVVTNSGCQKLTTVLK